MSYVDTILQPGENILHRGRLHWIIHVPAMAIMFAGIALFLLGGYTDDAPAVIRVPMVALFVAGVILYIRSRITKWTTEIAVTDRRVILKTGLIARNTREMNLHQVESVEVNQSVLGRILDYGTVQVHGSGVGLEAIAAVSDPIVLRTSITAR